MGCLAAGFSGFKRHLPADQREAHLACGFLPGEGRDCALAAQLGGVDGPARLRVEDAHVGHAAFGEAAQAGLQRTQGGAQHVGRAAGDGLQRAPQAGAARGLPPAQGQGQQQLQAGGAGLGLGKGQGFGVGGDGGVVGDERIDRAVGQGVG